MLWPCCALNWIPVVFTMAGQLSNVCQHCVTLPAPSHSSLLDFRESYPMYVVVLGIWAKNQGNSNTELVLWTPSSFISYSSYSNHLSGPELYSVFSPPSIATRLWAQISYGMTCKVPPVRKPGTCGACLMRLPSPKDPSPMLSFLHA